MIRYSSHNYSGSPRLGKPGACALWRSRGRSRTPIQDLRDLTRYRVGLRQGLLMPRSTPLFWLYHRYKPAWVKIGDRSGVFAGISQKQQRCKAPFALSQTVVADGVFVLPQVVAMHCW